MTLSQILIFAANMLDDSVLASSISNNSFDTVTTAKVNLLISCANQVSSIIALDYNHIYGTARVSSSDGRIALTSLNTNGVYGITKVSSGGVACDYTIEGNYLVTSPGQVQVKFLSQPTSLTALNQQVTDFPYIPARVFAYGVAAEYLYIKGNIDDADAWNNRFEKALFALSRSTKNRVIKARRWY